jgi:hypothetical protein
MLGNRLPLVSDSIGEVVQARRGAIAVVLGICYANTYTSDPRLSRMSVMAIQAGHDASAQAA